MACNAIASILLILLATCAGSSAQVGTGPLNGQRFWGEMLIHASPQVVWEALTDKRHLCAISGFDDTGEDRKLEQVGVHFTSAYAGDSGTVILAYAEPLSELRYTWEPDNGSYICQARWRLVPAGGHTRVLFEERYTLSGVLSSEMLAQEVAHYGKAIAQLKELCEQHGQ